MCWVWCHTPAIPELWKTEVGESKSQAHSEQLNSYVTPCLKIKNTEKRWDVAQCKGAGSIPSLGKIKSCKNVHFEKWSLMFINHNKPSSFFLGYSNSWFPFIVVWSVLSACQPVKDTSVCEGGAYYFFLFFFPKQ